MAENSHHDGPDIEGMRETLDHWSDRIDEEAVGRAEAAINRAEEAQEERENDDPPPSARVLDEDRLR